MKRLSLILALSLVLAVVGLPALAQRTIYVSPDVPTDPDGPPIYLPWHVVEHTHANGCRLREDTRGRQLERDFVLSRSDALRGNSGHAPKSVNPASDLEFHTPYLPG